MTAQHGVGPALPPIAWLMAEHVLILRAVDLLDRECVRLAEGGPVRQPILESLLGFFSDFADRLHHGKEEQILFPFMADGMDYPRTAGPISVLSADHTAGRRHVEEMRRVQQALQTDAAAAHTFAGHGQTYAALLRAHIEREDHKVFCTVEDLLGPEEAARLARAFAALDVKEGGAADYHAVLDALERAAADEAESSKRAWSDSEASASGRHTI